jgi:glycosyltransferase involved in cell wall biosynthesis
MNEVTLNSNSPFFSVVIPLYNRSDSITETINSVLTQTYQNFEVVIIDDGSQDNPESVISKINDSRIRFIKQANQGGARARNRGIEEARSEYIVFLDSDDFFAPEKLTVLYETIQKNPDFHVFISYTYVDRGDGVFAVKPSRPLSEDERVDEFLFCKREVIPTTTITVKKSTYEKVQFQNGLKKGQDIDYVLKLAHAGYKFFFIKRPLSIWVDVSVGNRISHINQAQALEDWLMVGRQYMNQKAYYAYRANVLSYEIARIKPFIALKDLFLGFVLGGVNLRNILQSTLRAFVPQPVYRKMVNSFLKIRKLLIKTSTPREAS